MATVLLPEHLVALLIPLTYLAMVAVEQMGTGHRWPAARDWQVTGLQFFVMLGVVNGLSSKALVTMFPSAHLFDGRRLGLVGGVVLGYLLLSLGNALLHRAYHRFDLLWRHVHRLHHLPQRLDVAGVMYQTPLEALANSLLFVLVTVFLLGLPPLASMLCAFVASFYGMFQHFNIRTPAWLGLLIQRPEAHCLHHRRGVHAWNYSDLPLWDMLWGRFRNPRDFEGELGFGEAAPSMAQLIRARWRR